MPTPCGLQQLGFDHIPSGDSSSVAAPNCKTAAVDAPVAGHLYLCVCIRISCMHVLIRESFEQWCEVCVRVVHDIIQELLHTPVPVLMVLMSLLLSFGAGCSWLMFACWRWVAPAPKAILSQNELSCGCRAVL